MGFPELPLNLLGQVFPVPRCRKMLIIKNNHASAWHMDLQDDVRSLARCKANTEWWSTVLHELSRYLLLHVLFHPDVPMVLRGGANRGYHEAFGSYDRYWRLCRNPSWKTSD